jgi:hypothetical protein
MPTERHPARAGFTFTRYYPFLPSARRFDDRFSRVPEGKVTEWDGCSMPDSTRVVRRLSGARRSHHSSPCPRPQ